MTIGGRFSGGWSEPRGINAEDLRQRFGSWFDVVEERRIGRRFAIFQLRRRLPSCRTRAGN